MDNEWFKKEKVNFFKKERKDLLKGKPKKDGSGGGMRLNKGRGGCPPSKQETTGKGMSNLAGGMILTAGGIIAGTKLIGAIGDIDL